MKTSEVLERALEKLGPNGERWCKGYYHRTSDGSPCGPLVADKHCAVGAMWVIVGDAGLVANAADYLQRVWGGKHVSDVNDHAKDFSEIRAGFLQAISLAKQQEQANDN